MKRIAAIALLAFTLAPAVAWAIPQSSGGIFQGAGGTAFPLEEWLREAAHWLPGAELPGQWTPASTDPNHLETTSPGNVFGVGASSAVIVRSPEGAIKSVVVRFDPGKTSRAALLARLKSSVTAFLNSKKWETTNAGQTSTGGALTVLLAQSSAGAAATATITLATP